MPIVVSDAGPLIHLSQIGKLPLLEKLFGAVLVAEWVKVEVYDEGTRRGYADAEIIATALEDGWLKVEAFPKRLVGSAMKLAEGENISRPDAETLLLAVDKKAELLADDRLLFDLAKMYRLQVLNTWTLILEGLSRDYLKIGEVQEAIEQLGKKKFRLNAKQTKEILDAARTIDKRRNSNALS